MWSNVLVEDEGLEREAEGGGLYRSELEVQITNLKTAGSTVTVTKPK